MTAISLKKILILAMTLMSLIACSKNDGGRSARSNGGGGAPLNPAGNAGCGTSQQSLGRIFDSGSSGASGSFEQRVKALVSASADPAAFGTISGNPSDPQTGVTVEGKIHYDASGNVSLSQSNLTITVIDSYVGQKDTSGAIVESYPITFSSANQGQVNVSAKTFTLQFKDGYGEVTLSGRFEGANVTGSVSFQNYTVHPNVGGSPAAGVLGSFTIPTCAFVN